MNLKALVILSVLLLAAVPSMAMVQSIDAADPSYVEPPEADKIISLSLSMRSDDPTLTVRLDSDYSELAGELAEDIKKGLTYSSYHHSVTEQHCLPSWITWESGSEDKPGNQFGLHYFLDIRISPALQQVSEDTHGEYWIFFHHVYSAMFNSDEDRYLIKISLDVKWNGSVIVPDIVYHTYALTFDANGGTGGITQCFTIPAVKDSGIYYVDTLSVGPVKPGFRFIGWSTVLIEDGKAPIDVPGSYPFQSAQADSVDSSDPQNIVYSKTIYAVWEKEGVYIPTLFDALIELFTDPFVLVFMVAGIFGTAYFIRGRQV